MPMRFSTACPICGNLSPQRVSDERIEVQFFEQRRTGPTEAYHRYRCTCGADFVCGFNESEQIELVPVGSIEPTLAAKVVTLQKRIRELLDNPKRQIVGLEGEAYIAEIRWVATQCEAKGLREVAGMLNQLGRDVMQRWAG